AARVLERHFGLPRTELSSLAGPVPVFPLGRSALAVFPPGHPLVEGDARPGVHHLALAVDDLDAAGARVVEAGRPMRRQHASGRDAGARGEAARASDDGATTPDNGETPKGGAPTIGLGGRRVCRLPREATCGVRVVLTERLELAPRGGGPVERLDHVGVAS